MALNMTRGHSRCSIASQSTTDGRNRGALDNSSSGAEGLVPKANAHHGNTETGRGGFGHSSSEIIESAAPHISAGIRAQGLAAMICLRRLIVR
jgi:hypothetical protein